jgi:glycosyltransferase involved in cell wall biosynthesis
VVADQAESTTMKLTVIVPAYNEEKTISTILDSLLSTKGVNQIIVVDDASSDKTATIVKAYSNKKILLISHGTNQGKGKAIRTGLSQASGDFVMIQDADLEYDPREIPVLLQPILSGRAEVVYGSRFFGAHTNMFYWHFLGNKFLNFVINILYDSILSDMETCYKVLPTTVLRDLHLTENDFRIEPEITCKLLLKHIKIFEVPITYVGRTYTEGKKITWKDGVLAMATILRIRCIGR